MKEWMTSEEIAFSNLVCMPNTKRGVNKIAGREGWAKRKNMLGQPLARRRKEQGGGLEYHYSLLPDISQIKIVRAISGQNKEPKNKPRFTNLDQDWAHYDRLPDTRKAVAKNKLRILKQIRTLHLKGGVNKDDAIAQIAYMESTSKATIYNWFSACHGVDEKDWLPCLVDRRGGNTRSAVCDPLVWEMIKTDYLRVEKPSFTVCYLNVKGVADERGLSIPAERTLYRRIMSEIPVAVRILTRDGVDALKASYIPQRRDRSDMNAMTAVNADGHKWDVFVKWPGIEKPVRPLMLAFQDLYSNKFLSWRLDISENSDSVRLAIADMIRDYGIPEHCYLDNGRGFASKWITGGTPNRYRFKVKPEEPSGVLTQLGVEVHWTTPYSGQSKPIERAFKDLCDSIAKHPRFAGAYTGNSPDAKPENYMSKAIPLDEFLVVMNHGMHLHNARPNRNTKVCGRKKSFDQAFKDSYEHKDTLIRKDSAKNYRDFLLAAEQVKAHKMDGHLNLLGNRYWDECMLDFRGQSLVVRFDPDDLHAGVNVYRQDGSFIAELPCREDAGFMSTSAGREHNRARREFMKNAKRNAEIEKSLDLEEYAKLIAVTEAPEIPETKVIQIVKVGSNLTTQEIDVEAAVEEDSFFEDFSEGLSIIVNNDEL